jgi:hypothetical protein
VGFCYDETFGRNIEPFSFGIKHEYSFSFFIYIKKKELPPILLLAACVLAVSYYTSLFLKNLAIKENGSFSSPFYLCWWWLGTGRIYPFLWAWYLDCLFFGGDLPCT